MTILYRPAAVEDLRKAIEYFSLQLKNPKAATRLKTRVLHSVSYLKENPKLGMQLGEKLEGMETDIRFLVVDHQLVFYRISDKTVEIIRILDGRTDYLAKLFSDLS